MKKIFSEQLEKIKIPEKEEEKIRKISKAICSEIDKRIKTKSFVGGSIAKGTALKRKKYDVDIFVMFQKKFAKKDEKMSNLLEKALKEMKEMKEMKGKKLERIHASRDYFVLHFPFANFEIIPILETKKSKEALNTTDLSPFHIKYVIQKIKKNPKLANEIKLAKSFCYANNFYGAESYIRGFSGYALEVLVCYYKSFLNFLRAASKWKSKFVIDPEKHYKSKQQIFMHMNEEKLKAPIILIDPTYKERNITASFSQENFFKFVRTCKAFLARPNRIFFEEKKLNLELLKKNARKKKAKFILIKARAKAKEREIAAAKLYKFFNFVLEKAKKDFDVLERGWELMNHSAIFCFVLKEKKKIVAGPFLKMEYNAKQFIKKHKKFFIKEGRLYTKIYPKTSLFLKNLKKSKDAREMGILFLD